MSLKGQEGDTWNGISLTDLSPLTSRHHLGGTAQNKSNRQPDASRFAASPERLPSPPPTFLSRARSVVPSAPHALRCPALPSPRPCPSPTLGPRWLGQLAGRCSASAMPSAAQRHPECDPGGEGGSHGSGGEERKCVFFFVVFDFGEVALRRGRPRQAVIVKCVGRGTGCIPPVCGSAATNAWLLLTFVLLCLLPLSRDMPVVFLG